MNPNEHHCERCGSTFYWAPANYSFPPPEPPTKCGTCTEKESRVVLKLYELQREIDTMIQESIAMRRSPDPLWQEISDALIRAKLGILTVTELRKYAQWPTPKSKLVVGGP